MSVGGHQLYAEAQAVHDVTVAGCYVCGGSVIPDQQDARYEWVATNNDVRIRGARVTPVYWSAGRDGWSWRPAVDGEGPEGHGSSQ